MIAGRRQFLMTALGAAAASVGGGALLRTAVAQESALTETPLRELRELASVLRRAAVHERGGCAGAQQHDVAAGTGDHAQPVAQRNVR